MTNVKVLKDTIKKWVHEYNMLDACLELTQGKIAELEAVNVRLREKFNNLISTPIYENCNLLLEQKRRLEKYLQEIKAIAETPKPFIDFSETKTAIEVEYDYAAICKELELRLYKVLELITKAEEE